MLSAKRAKHAEVLWSADFDTRCDLERIVKAVREIGMTNITFCVTRDTSEGGFTGLRAEVKNSSLTSLLRAQIACDIEKKHDTDKVVTVACDSLLGVLRGSGKPQFRLQLSQHEGDTNLFIRSFDSFDKSFSSHTTMQTLVEEEHDPLPLDELAFQCLQKSL